MSDTTRLDELLSLWQQAAERGEAASTRELCRDHPELLDELQRRVDQLRQLGRLAEQVNAATTITGSPIVEASSLSLPQLPGYDVQSELGAGGMGVVFQARDRQLNRIVAVKMLKGGTLTAKQSQRFLAEAQTVARLNHPHIVQLFAFGEHEGQPYLIMELVPGQNLQARTQGVAQPAADAARLVLLLARAVQAAHDQGIVHRDLKPANVLLAPPLADPALNSALGCPKLTDFGLALRRDVRSDTHAGEVAGTPSFMAPEQAVGDVEGIGPETDVYALGGILYQLLTSRPPFRGATIAETLRQVMYEDPVPLRLLQPDLPRDLATICLKCLHKEIARRYSSAQELADDLQRYLAGEPIVARPIGRIERAWKWARRKPGVAAALAGLGIAVVVTLLALAIAWREAEHAAQQAEHAAQLQAGRADYERHQREKTEEQLYLYQIALSHREIVDNRSAWAEAALRQAPARLRGWEWRHLLHRCQHPAAGYTHDGRVSSVAAAPDGTRFASAHSDGTILLWDMNPAAVMARRAASTTAQLAAAGPLPALASLCPGREALPYLVLRGHLGSVNWLAFSPAGDELYSGGEDGVILSWDSRTGAQRFHFAEHDGPISCLAVHPVQPWIASTMFSGNRVGEVLVWDRTTRQVLHRLQGHGSLVAGLAFHPTDGTLVSASHDRTLIVWHAGTGARLRTLTDHRYPVSCVAFSPNGRTLASAAGSLKSRTPEDSEILVWETATGQVRHRLRGHAERAITLAFTPDGARLATAGWDHRIFLWQPTTGQELLSLSGHSDGVFSVAFTRQGQLLSGSYDRTVRIWEAP